MGNVSYSAHISNGKSAISNKAKLAGVAKHNLRKYKSEEYSSESIILLHGTKDLYQDVRNIYHEEFNDAVREYNQKQKREDRKIKDYFEHVSNLNQDMAVEIIFQCGDSDYWCRNYKNRDMMDVVYSRILHELQELLPDFKIANAVVHMDEASPHMHVVGVPVKLGTKKGLIKKVSKRSVFTPEVLSTVLQDELRKRASRSFRVFCDEELAEKQKGRNHDLSVVEYKVAKETEHLDIIEEKIGKYSKELVDTESEFRENEIIQKRKIKEYEEKLAGLKLFVNNLSRAKEYIGSLLPMSPLIEEYAIAVEQKKRIEAGDHFRGILYAIGELLDSFKELIKGCFYWFPRLMKWCTSKGEVAPIFNDFANEGCDYELKGYVNVKTKEQYSIESVQHEIKAENRIGTLEQLKQGIEAAQIIGRGLYKKMEDEEYERRR